MKLIEIIAWTLTAIMGAIVIGVLAVVYVTFYSLAAPFIFLNWLGRKFAFAH